MISTTDKLRQLLTGRGVEWLNVKYEGKTYGVKWRGVGGIYFLVTEYDNENDDGTVYLHGVFMTPEQAVAATLGRGTCHLVETVHQREIASEFGGGCYDETTYDCDECGFENIDYNIRFCGGCGREVVDADD